LEIVPDEKARIPIPPERNVLWKPPLDMSHPLSSFQEDFVLSVCPKGTRILYVRFHRLVRLPCPVWVRVLFPDGGEETLILRMDYALHGVEWVGPQYNNARSHLYSMSLIASLPYVTPLKSFLRRVTKPLHYESMIARQALRQKHRLFALDNRLP
jgi:hypothetical protein